MFREWIDPSEAKRVNRLMGMYPNENIGEEIEGGEGVEGEIEEEEEEGEEMDLDFYCCDVLTSDLKSLLGEFVFCCAHFDEKKLKVIFIFFFYFYLFIFFF